MRRQELWAGSFFIRPSAGIEYYRLSEDGYQEEGGGTALDLTVDKRKSDELAVNALLIAGFEMGGTRPTRAISGSKLEAGRRQIVGGSLGDTSARFEDGETFVLEPEERESGWVGRLRGCWRQFGLPHRRRSRRRGAREPGWTYRSGEPHFRHLSPKAAAPISPLRSGGQFSSTGSGRSLSRHRAILQRRLVTPLGVSHLLFEFFAFGIELVVERVPFRV